METLRNRYLLTALRPSLSIIWNQGIDKAIEIYLEQVEPLVRLKMQYKFKETK